MKICVQGLGYVGAATAVLLASIKLKKKKIFEVYGLEVRTSTGLERANKLKNFNFPFYTEDKNIKNYLQEIKKNSNFKVTTNNSVLSDVDVVIVSLSLDIKKNFKSFNDTNFLKAIRNIGRNINEDTLVIIQSTVPIGYTRKIIYPILKKYFHKRKLNLSKLYLAHSYERVTPGKNYLNSIKNSHRAYAGINEKSEIKCKYFLSRFINHKKYPLTKMQNTDASELSKILENSYRAMNIAFIEEWRLFSESIKIDLEKIVKNIRLRKTHSNLMMPGLGVGGYCLTKDPIFAGLSAKRIYKKNLKFPYSTAAVKTNINMLNNNISKIRNILKKIKEKKIKILIFGLSYKEDVEDLRNSPSVKLAKSLLKQKKYIIYFYDDFIKNNVSGIKKLKFVKNLQEFNLLIFAVKHSSFKKLKFDKLNLSKETIVYDANLVLDDKQTKDLKKKIKKIYKVGYN